MKQTDRKAFIWSSILAALFLFQMACTPSDLSKTGIIPKPLSINSTGEEFDLTDQTNIYLGTDSPELLWIGQYLADHLNPATGLNMVVKFSSEMPEPGQIFLSLSDDETELGDEGYKLTITDKLVHLTARHPAGLFYGVQTIRQIFPPKIEMETRQKGPWKLATGVIRDFPEYGYRGAMLDVARHFFTVEEVKSLIDYLAFYKLNRLHLHLTDDQGWRIEIKSWSNLTAQGAQTEVGGGEGGFYTQDEYSEIVKYAQERFIMVVPEIDMPGHTNAALASYPELNCDGKARELYTGIKVGFSTLCTGSKATKQFVTDVIRELSAITPGNYIHIGGDESHSTKIEDYIPFMNMAQEIAHANGKQVIGWDEIALAKLQPNTIVQHWAKGSNAIKGVAQGATVLMSPSTYAYLDMQYDSTCMYGLHWAGYIEVDKAYNWDPANLFPEIKKEHIAGIEAPLWTETLTNLKDAEYMIFPRLQGFAEIGWTQADSRNWDDYKIRLAKHGGRMKAMNINYYPSELIDWEGKHKREK